MDTLWFVVLTAVLAKPVVDGGPEKLGDVIFSSIVAASETEDGCERGGDRLADYLFEQGGGSVMIAHDCVELPADAARIMGMQPVSLHE